jgi:hypothetical protein
VCQKSINIRHQIISHIDGIEAALAGDYTDGDYCWTDNEAKAARRASEKFKRGTENRIGARIGAQARTDETEKA